MNLQSVVDRIKAQCPGFKVVGGAAEFDIALQAAPAAPACYVIPQREDAEPSPATAFILQTVTVEFGIVYAVRNAKSSAGQEGIADLETLRASVRTALMGWQPITATKPITFAGATLLDFQPGLMWWQDGFTTAHRITN